MTKTPALSDSNRPGTQAAMFLFATFALGQAVEVNDGNLHPLGLMWIGVAMVTLLVGVRERELTRLAKVPLTPIVASLLCLQWVQLLLWGLCWRRLAEAPIHLFIIPMIAAGVGAGVIFLGNRFHRIGLIMLVAGHTLCGAYVIRHMTQPRIDVWYFQQASTEALVHGQNPYDVRYRNIYEPERDFYGPGAVVDGYMTISYPYPPLTLLVTAPGRLLGDVRWAHLAAMELAVALIVLAAPSRTATWAAAMLLLSPRSLMIIYCAWTESLVVLALATVVYCAMRAPKHLWMALGIFLAMKQYTVLVLPLALLLLQRSAIKSVATKAFSLAMLIALPFVLWNPMSFVRSVVLMQFNQPFRIESLSFAAMFAVVTGIQIPSLIGFVFAGGALVWCLQKASRSLAGFAGSTALVLLLFFAFNKQAFCNYYFGVIGACCGAMAVSAPHRARALREESSLPLRIAA